MTDTAAKGGYTMSFYIVRLYDLSKKAQVQTRISDTICENCCNLDNYPQLKGKISIIPAPCTLSGTTV